MSGDTEGLVTVTLTEDEADLITAQAYEDATGWNDIAAKVKAAAAGKPDEWREYRV